MENLKPGDRYNLGRVLDLLEKSGIDKTILVNADVETDLNDRDYLNKWKSKHAVENLKTYKGMGIIINPEDCFINIRVGKDIINIGCPDKWMILISDDIYEKIFIGILK